MFNVYGYVHRNNALVYNSNNMHKAQSLFNLTTSLHVSGVTITHLQEHKTTVTTASGNRYTVTYIIHYSIELTAFSTEYTLFSNCNFNLVYRYFLSVNLTLSITL
jgi:hypothetical protein